MYSLEKISKNRNLIYGLTTLYIAFYHCSFRIFNKYLFAIKNTGNVGVDIFLLMSGICLYFSLKKDPSIRKFYKKRFSRILLPYLIVYIPYFVYISVSQKENIIFFLRKILLVDLFITNDMQVWFVTAIVILYLLYPLINKLLYYQKFQWKWFAIDNIVLWSFAFFLRGEYGEIFFSRIPIFFCGAYLGKFVYEGLKIDKKRVLYGAVIVVIIGYLIKVAIPDMHIYIRIAYYFMAMAIVVLLSFGADKLPNILKKVIYFYGNITLEVYLLHELILGFLQHMNNVILSNVIAIILATVLAYFLRKVCDKINRRPVRERISSRNK